MKFIIDDKIPYINGILEQFGEVRYISGKSICHNDVKDALGTFVALLIAKETEDQQFKDACWNDLNVNFRKPLKRGFKKAVTAELRPTFQGTQAEFTQEVNKQTDKEVEKRIRNLKKFLD